MRVKPNASHIRRFTVGSNLIVIDSSRSAEASLVKHTITAILQESATPLANDVSVKAEPASRIICKMMQHSDSDRAIW